MPPHSNANRPRPNLIIVFEVEQLLLGIDVQQLREVFRMMPLTPLPGAGAVTGMITLRGESTAVVDLRVLFGLPADQRDHHARMIAVNHENTAVCLIADNVVGLHELEPTDLEEPPSVLAGADLPWLEQVFQSGSGRLIGIVDLPRLLTGVALTQPEHV